MELIDLVRMIVREEISYLEKDMERQEKQLRALAKAVGKRIPYEATWVIEDETQKDE